MRCCAARVWFGGWAAWVRPKGIEFDWERAGYKQYFSARWVVKSCFNRVWHSIQALQKRYSVC